MDQPGRKSLESLRVVTSLPGQRPEPPESLSVQEAAVWRAVVATKPADWFMADTFPLLADYCTACVQQELVRAALRKEPCSNELIQTLDRLAKLKMGLATKMRLTHQSRWQPSVAATASKRAGTAARPWEGRTGT